MELLSHNNYDLKLPNAKLSYTPNFYSKEESNYYFKHINSETNWQNNSITVFGKTYKEPRLTSLFGNTSIPYNYADVTMEQKPFSPALTAIKNKVESFSGFTFNTLLINLYRNGSDSNGWHADNEKVLGKNPIIASLSFGEERAFHFKHRSIKEERHKLILGHGSLLLMKGEMQHYWLHQIAKTKKIIAPRINLTFRNVVTV